MERHTVHVHFNIQAIGGSNKKPAKNAPGASSAAPAGNVPLLRPGKKKLRATNDFLDDEPADDEPADKSLIQTPVYRRGS
jgi:hypothetical protein